MSDKNMAQQLFVHYKSRLIQLSNGLKPSNLNVESALDKNDKHLVCEGGVKENIKVGDRVKIKLKKRQLKQRQGDNWNELITKDIGEVGTVVSLLPDGIHEPVVCFPQSGRRWVIDPSALSNVSSEFSSDGSETFAFGDLKVGDYVDLAYENDVVQALQGNQQSPWNQIFMFHQFLGRILSFQVNGYAYVNINENLSLLINSAALKRRTSDPKKEEQERSLKIPQYKVHKTYPLHTHVFVKNDVAAMLRQPFWKYPLTQLLGARGKVTYHGMNGEVGVTIKDKTWILPEVMYEKKSKRQRKNSGHAFQANSLFRWEVNDLVVFGFAHHISFQRTLEGLRMPPAFEQICQGVGKFLGYENARTCIVQKDGQRIRSNIADLLSESDFNNKALFDQFRTAESERKKIKVGDTVHLNIGPWQLASCVLNDIKVKPEILEVILSPAKVVAFDDDQDKALLEFKNGKLYSIDPNFVTFLSSEHTGTIPDPFQKFSNVLDMLESGLDVLNRSIAHSEKKHPINDITEGLQYAEEIKEILNSLGVSFCNPAYVVSESNLISTLHLKVDYDDEVVPDMCKKFEETLNVKVVKEGSSLRVSNPEKSVLVNLNFGEATEDLTQVQAIQNSPEEAEQLNVDATAASKEEENEIQIVEETLADFSQRTSDETFVTSDHPLVVDDAPDAPDDTDNNDQQPSFEPTSSGDTVRQNVEFYPSTKEIVVTCRKLDPQPSSSTNPKQVLHSLFPKPERQNSAVQENYRSGGVTYNFFNASIDNCYMGTQQ